MQQRLLFVSSPVGPLPSGIVGGVRNAILNAYQGLEAKGYSIEIVAPEGSRLKGYHITEVSGKYQPSLPCVDDKSIYPIVEGGFLPRAWEYALEQQSRFDIILNFANDWLPYYLGPFFTKPVLHRVNLSGENAAVSQQLRSLAGQDPHRIGVLSRAQAQDIGLPETVYLLGQGIPVKHYPFFEKPQTDALLYLGRVSPEKGIEDALTIAQALKRTLRVAGYLQDAHYLDTLRSRFGSTLDYRGFLNHQDMMREMESAAALLLTPSWNEAFGQVLIEALACGLPVITYRQGGPGEIIDHGETGLFICRDNLEAACASIASIDTIDRKRCRQVAEERFSLEGLCERYQKWFNKLN